MQTQLQTQATEPQSAVGLHFSWMKKCAVLVAFLISGNKHLTRSDLRWEGFLSAYSSRWSSPSLLESRQQEQVVAGDLELTVRKQRDESCWLLSLTVSS